MKGRTGCLINLVRGSESCSSQLRAASDEVPQRHRGQVVSLCSDNRDGKGKDKNGNDKGRNLLELIRAQNGHFSFLRNWSLRLGELTEDEISALPVGTASLEAWHAELKRWGECVVRQSGFLLDTKFLVAVFLKLSVHLHRTYWTKRKSQGAAAQRVSAKIRTDTTEDILLEEVSDKVFHEREVDRISENLREKLWQAFALRPPAPGE